MTVITGKQRSVLVYMIWFRHNNGCTPTIDEIGDHFHLAKRTVHDHCSALERKGFISREPRKPRSIRIKLFEAFS